MSHGPGGKKKRVGHEKKQGEPRRKAKSEQFISITQQRGGAEGRVQRKGSGPPDLKLSLAKKGRTEKKKDHEKEKNQGRNDGTGDSGRLGKKRVLPRTKIALRC